MPKINVYLPDDLPVEVKAAGIPVSAVCQQALADAVAQAQTMPAGTAGHDLERSFTKRAYAVLTEAGELAARDGRPATSVDVVAALAGSGGLALSVLRAADIEADDLVDELQARASRGGAPASDLDAVAERAVEQARGLEHTYVGTEHLLLALTAGPTHEPAAETLRDMGLDHERAFRGVVTALSAYSYARETLTFSGLSAPIRAALEDIRSRLARLEERRVS